MHHTEGGTELLRNFLIMCGANFGYTVGSLKDALVQAVRHNVGCRRVVGFSLGSCVLIKGQVLACSGGVDSTVTAKLLQVALGSQVTCVFINNGLLRLGEFQAVQELLNGEGIAVTAVDASDTFLDALKGINDPERRRKVVGKVDTIEGEGCPWTDGCRFL